MADLKRKICKDLKVPTLSNVTLFSEYRKLVKQGKIKPNKQLESLLVKRPVRSLSGVVNISVLTKPYPCPGNCLYCPAQEDMPKSYLKGEPAAQRAHNLKYDPYEQVIQRIKVLEMEGHNTDKIDLRIIGANWSSYPKSYKDKFVALCFHACNNGLKKKPLKNISLEKEQKKNEKAKHRVIGLAVETRPDYITEKEINHLRKLGVTRVELGIQSIYDDILEKNRRGHKVEASIKATELLKNAGFKITYQMMPNLYGSSIKKDLEMFKILFNSSKYQPDSLKIYPLVVVKEAPLYKLWKNKKHKSYSLIQLKKLLEDIKLSLPYYVRVERVIRDIPSQYALNEASKITNLRQILHDELKEKGLSCKCIRCREVKDNFKDEPAVLFRQDYDASNGKEIFLSFEDKERKNLFAILRLRINKNKALVRELHTYGQQLAISSKEQAPQHKGLGKSLVKEAEKIAFKEFRCKELSIISGIGVRPYYRKLGYRLFHTYMVKKELDPK